MSETLNKTWKFTQKSFVKDNNLGGIGTSTEGICISLSSRWAKMFLKADKGMFSVPKLPGQTRDTYFSKPGTPKKIAINQELFDQERESARSEFNYVRASLKTARDAFNNGEISWNEYEILSKATMKGAENTAEASKVSLQRILSANKLRIVATQSCQSFAEYFLGAKSGECYVFSSDDLQHACAGYVTSGAFSKDYYFFDPNSGEFIASGDSEIAVVMDRFKKHYAKQGYVSSKTDRFTVEYSK